MDVDRKASDIQLAKKLLALSPDDLLLKIALHQATRPQLPKILEVLVLAYRAVCEQRLESVLKERKEDHD